MPLELHFGPRWSKPGVSCCGKPEGCTITSPTCVFRTSPRKGSNRPVALCSECGFGELATWHSAGMTGGLSHSFSPISDEELQN